MAGTYFRNIFLGQSESQEVPHEEPPQHVGFTGARSCCGDLIKNTYDQVTNYLDMVIFF